MSHWHQKEKEETVQALNSSVQNGLSQAQAAERLEKHGPNELIERGVKNPWKILWEQLTGIMVVMLIISAVISILLHEYKDAIVILVIVVLNAVLGFTQEYRAEQALAALKRMAVPKVRVRREGHVQEISSRELVPGDIVLLEAGSAIPADCRVLESVNLRVQEAVLTGESEPVDKITTQIPEENVAIGDQRNMLFMGTITTFGRGQAVVVETGMATQLGKIAEMIQTVTGEMTPLQKRLDQLGKGLAIAALVIVAIVFGLGLLRGEEVRLMFMTAISMAVAAVPEGLPAVVTIALAIGAQRMLSRNALIRKLPAVETLGSVTVICTDKTGTLTENRMTVSILDVAGNTIDVKEHARDYSPYLSPSQAERPNIIKQDAVSMLLVSGALCNDAILEAVQEDEGGFTTVGDPTEGALVVAAARFGLWKKELEEAMPRVSELPFDSERKRMSTVHQILPEQMPEMLAKLWRMHPQERQPEYIVITKGAVDGLLDISDRIWNQGEVSELDETWRERIRSANDGLAKKGMRVLGVAFRSRDHAEIDEKNDPLETGLVFVGMFGMIDPARPEVLEAVQTAQTAGIRPVMITGDHPLTAFAIAEEIGISDGSPVITGQQLAQMDTAQLEAQVEHTAVYARVSPEHKLRIVEALQKRGHIVAMTGDGVNDAPALKRADIGVAMGITGTDVSKEASDMILLDDNFATIVAAVGEGRRIYDNIRKFIRYTMTSNAGEIWVMLLAPFLGMPLPLTPIQILWVNLVTDGLPGLALTIEKQERNTMRRPPYAPNENIFGRGMATAILWIGLLIGLLSLGVGFLLFREGQEHWRTVLFTTLTFTQLGNAIATRSERDNIFRIGFFSNPTMLGAVALTFLLQLAVIYVPFLQNIFQTTNLTFIELLESIGLAVVTFLTIEAVKWLRFRKNNA